MANTSSRTLRLLSLLQTHRYWPGSELADRLEVSVRTLRRDVDRLRELGYPVEANRGVDGGYQLAAGAAMPPLVLDDEEAVALAVGLQAAAAAATGRGAADGDGPGDLRGRRTRGGSGSAHHRRAGLPRHRAVGVRLRRRRRSADEPPRGAFPARPARPPLVPRRLRPAPSRLAELPPRPARRSAADGCAVPPPRPACRRRGGVRPLGPPQPPDLLRRGGALRRAGRRGAGAGRALGERRGGRRRLPHADEHGLAGLGRLGRRSRGRGLHRRGPGGTGAAP